MSEVEFINGLIIKAPTEKQIYTKARLSLNREKLITWLQEQEDEWINADIKVSRNGNWYAAVNRWKPDGERESEATMPAREQTVDPVYKGDDFKDDDIPF